ncbi:MAG: phospholipase D family protein [Betaproteobacteria bacterium]|nr:phospholipase D family protein [Betaproteobacteria bacterium]
MNIDTADRRGHKNAAPAFLFALFSMQVFALQPAPPVAPFAATGTLQYAFTAEHHADEMIIAAIDAARRQVLMQAYILTHRRIADALVRAKSRGLEVAVIADHEQARANPAIVRDLMRAGIPLLADAQHAAAHNKVIVIDTGHADCAVVTGSFNFTYAAQHRNAENALVLRGNPPLCDAYFNNWRRHQAHSHAQTNKQ